MKKVPTQRKTTLNLRKTSACARSPAGKITTLDIKAAKVEYAIQLNNLNTLEFSSIFSELRTPKDLERYVAIDVTAITKTIFEDKLTIKLSN
tara:strand:+ start:180 stop:455 length:276 start_codon:yes stop_codon:yes gene_type:complete